MRVVLYHPKVPAEARQATDYYEAISPALGDRFWGELLEAIEYARQFPEHHHFDPCGLRRSNLKKFPYHFLFRTGRGFIRITAIRHNRRNPRYGSKRK